MDSSSFDRLWNDAARSRVDESDRWLFENGGDLGLVRQRDAIKELLRSDYDVFTGPPAILADDQFCGAFPGDVPARAWEMRIGAWLRNSGKNPRSANSGPDFVCPRDGHASVAIECVAPKRGEGPNAVRKPEYDSVYDAVDGPILLRLSNGICNKYTEQYQR